MTTIRDMLLSAPNSQLDKSVLPMVAAWSGEPSAIQILEVLDQTIHCGLASGFVVTFLQIAYDEACKREHTTHEQVAKLATWRKP